MGDMSYEDLSWLVGLTRASAHRRKVAAMRASGLHPEQVFTPLVLGGEADRSWWSTMEIRSKPEDWMAPWVGESDDDD